MNCLCNNSILPLIILMSCCGEKGTSGGILGFGGSGDNGLDQLLWLLCILCLCGGGMNERSSSGR
jgi:hypothetical protein